MIELKSFDGDYNENIDAFKTISKASKKEEGKKQLRRTIKKIEEYKKNNWIKIKNYCRK